MDPSHIFPDRARPAEWRAGLSRLWARRWAILTALVLLGGAGFALVRWLLGPEVVVYPAMRGDIVRTVVASGHVETPYRVEIASQITGIVEDVLVEEGQSVKRGQPLIGLERSELEAALVQAEGAVAQSDARIRQMKEVSLPAADQSLKQARATLDNAQSSYDRAEQLSRNGYGTRASLDEATKNLDIARTLVRTAELQVFTMSPGGSDFVMAQTQLSQSQANLTSTRVRLGYATITAPRDGVLISRAVERGTVVQPGRALMVLAPTGDSQLVLQVDEKNLGLIRLGQAALASADAYPDKRFAATVTYINPSVEIARASVEVKLTVPDPPAYLRQDMTVSVDIEVDRRDGVVVVPARTVHDAASADPWVLVVADGRAHEQPVKLGLRAADKVQVTQGLEPGALVVPIASGVRAGQRIRPVQP
jgi:HlyD family secretion protein